MMLVGQVESGGDHMGVGFPTDLQVGKAVPVPMSAGGGKTHDLLYACIPQIVQNSDGVIWSAAGFWISIVFLCMERNYRHPQWVCTRLVSTTPMRSLSRGRNGSRQADLQVLP